MSNKNALQGGNDRTSCISLRTPATNKQTQSAHRKARLEPAVRHAQKLAQNVFPPWNLSQSVSQSLRCGCKGCEVQRLRDGLTETWLQGLQRLRGINTERRTWHLGRGWTSQMVAAIAAFYWFRAVKIHRHAIRARALPPVAPTDH